MKTIIAALILGGLFFTAPTIYDAVFGVKKKLRPISVTKAQGTKLIKKTNPVTFKPIKPVYVNKKQVRKLTINPARTVYIRGPIGIQALGAAERISELSSSGTSPIFVILTSPGGSVISGAQVIAAIQASSAPVYTICYSFCASMASMIHQYGTRRYATDKSMIMFHPASARINGNMSEIYSFTTSMIRFISKIEIEIANRIGWSYSKYKALTAPELWVDSDEAKASNIIDQIIYTRVGFPSIEEAFNFGSKAGDKLKVNSRDLIWMPKGAM